MISINKEKYLKIEEIVLYLFGISFFTNFDIAKGLLYIILLFLMIDIFYFKEKLDCGNDKLKKFIFFLVLGGTVWNFCADFNYRAARAYLKINRYFILVFYLYSLVKYKKEILKKFLISLLVSYSILFIQGIDFYFKNKGMSYFRFGVFEGVMGTALICVVIGIMSFSQLIENREKKYKIISMIFLAISLFLLILTQTRAALLAFIGGIGIVILFSKNIKIILGTMILGVVLLGGFFKTSYSNRFKENTFNVKVTTDNMSNGLRVEMWKNAIWRFKQHPIMGSGTKQGYDLFAEYVKNMPEKTETQKIYKETFENGFDDAHSMYLNGLTDNGIFFLFQLIFILGIIPYILLKNKKYEFSLMLLGGCFGYYIYGVVWPIWRHGWDPMFLWLLISLSCIGFIYEKDITILKKEEMK